MRLDQRRHYWRNRQEEVERGNIIRPLERLTPRELDVVRALLAGYTTNPLIANYLGISPKTVQTHLTGIYTKLHIFRTVELVLVAIAEGETLTADYDAMVGRASGNH